MNKNGTLNEGDRLAGHFTLHLPAGRIHAKAVSGAICGRGDGTDCFADFIEFAGKVVNGNLSITSEIAPAQ